MISSLINSDAKVRLFSISAIVLCLKSDEWLKLKDEWLIFRFLVRSMRPFAPFLQPKAEHRPYVICDPGREMKKPYSSFCKAFVWEQRESNPRPSACKADALNQLSYAPFSCFFCPMAALDFARRSVITER